MEAPLLQHLPGELEQLAVTLGQPAYRGRQLFHWLHRRAARTFEEMRTLPAGLRRELAARFALGASEVLERQEDPGDGTRKYLLRLHDGETVEAVLMRQPYGLSVCVSTQVGCRMGCRFCASTLGGRVRDLLAGEMVEQVLAVQRDLPPGERVSHVVLMGIGEPLENYGEVIRFLRLVHEPSGLGIGYRHITLSTSGLVPRIRQLAAEGLPITLAVSLHAPNDALRSRLMPVNRRYGLSELLSACRDYIGQTGRRLSFEYVLIDSVNDAPELAAELAARLNGLLCHVNLIPLNPSGRGLAASSPERVRQFARVLRRHGLPVTVRRELGADIEAACGQLRRRRVEAAG